MQSGRTELKRSRIAKVLTVLLLGIAPFGTCAVTFAVRANLFWTGAERAVSEAVRATATGRRPDDVDVTVERRAASGASWDPASEFARPYTITVADNFPRGVSARALLDPLASAYVAELAFSGGRTWHAEAWREPNGRWAVRLWPYEGQ